MDASGQTLFTHLGPSPDAGLVWMPRGQHFRIAISGGLPFNTVPISYSCDPNNCDGNILPTNAVVPWDTTLCVARRFGLTAE